MEPLLLLLLLSSSSSSSLGYYTHNTRSFHFLNRLSRRKASDFNNFATEHPHSGRSKRKIKQTATISSSLKQLESVLFSEVCNKQY